MQSSTRQFLAHISSFLQPAGILYRKYRMAICLILLAAISIYTTYTFLWLTAPHGIGVRSDSVAYIWNARGLVDGIGIARLSGSGLVRPMTHWPPLYSMLLAAFESVRISGVIGARWLGAVLMGAIVLLSGLCVYRFSRSIWFSLAAAVVLAVTPGLWITGLYAMTEPLYLALNLLGFVFFDIYIEKDRWPWLAASGIAFAGCFLTRYIGFTVIGAAVLCLLLQRRWTIRQRLQRSFILGAVACLPNLAWMLRNSLLTSSAANRQFQIYPISTGDFNLAYQTLAGWVQPVQAIFQIGPGKLIIILAALASFAIWWLANKEDSEIVPDRSSIAILSGIYVPVYVFSVMASRAFFDPLITFFEQRIAFMIFIPLVFVILFLDARLFQIGVRRSLPLAAVWLCLNIVVFYSFVIVYQNDRDMQSLFKASRATGLDFNNIDVFPKCTVDAFKKISQNSMVYSDNIERLYYFTNRPSDQLNEIGMIDQIAKNPTQKDLVFVLFNGHDKISRLQTDFPMGQQACSSPFLFIVSNQAH